MGRDEQGSAMNFNRLLDYRPLEQLSRMDDRDRAELLAEILSKGPSKETWEAICELFALWPENAAKARYLDLAEQELSSWDDRLRFAQSDSGFLYDGERLSSLARLVKSIEIYRREQRGAAELYAIATSEYATRLTCLSIWRSEVSEAWQALVESPYLANLQHLHISKTVVLDTDKRRLLQSSGFARLRCLKLIDVGLTHESLDCVRQSIPFPELCRIDFSQNILGNQGVVLLSQAPWLQGIERLGLRHNFVAAPAMQALLSSPFLRRMQAIDFSESPVTDPEKASLIELAQKSNIELIV
jgi:hypothetical protein